MQEYRINIKDLENIMSKLYYDGSTKCIDNIVQKITKDIPDSAQRYVLVLDIEHCYKDIELECINGILNIIKYVKKIPAFATYDYINKAI